MDLSFGPSELNPEIGYRKEWLLANGLGGFAASTIIGLNTRRYHGLLVAALKPPVDRRLLVAKLDENLFVAGNEYPLGANQVHDGFYAQSGYRWLQSFERWPFPAYTYQIEDIFLIKTIFMVYGHNTTIIHYQIINEFRHPLALYIHPLVNCRDFHDAIFENAWTFDQQAQEREVTIEPHPGAPHIYLASDRAGYTMAPAWYRGMYYQAEQERGLPCHEDHFIPGFFTFQCQASEDFTLVVSAEPILPIRYQELETAAMERRGSLLQAAGCRDDFARQLVLAADDFLVWRSSTGKRTIIAGYPWFNDWGRDAMIALPGLTLCTGRSAEAREILATFAAYAKDGLIPNLFRDAGEEPLYNTVDAPLWFFYAVQKLIAYTSDYAFVQQCLYPAMKEIVGRYRQGTRFGIRMAGDGLVEAGEPGLQLTWMDAKVDDWVVTPRAGKPVEVNALWYNALMFMGELSAAFKTPDIYSKLASQVQASFCATFWNETGQCLYDVVDGENRDIHIRPNQVFAVSLPYSPLSLAQAWAVVQKVWQELYTPYGLRSLGPSDPEFRRRYFGNQWERDAAYHQGTVWSWLIGPFITAYRRVNGHDSVSLEMATRMLTPFQNHLRDHGLGSVSEIFDGDWPFTARGCFAQAWGVAELLRCWVEDLHEGEHGLNDKNSRN
ncbi:MAG: amylo-alpha-1,6-glucosidase [Thermacetogeniaceae bacterium]